MPGGICVERVADRLPLHLHRAHAEGEDVLQREAVAARVLLVPVRRDEDRGQERQHLPEDLVHGRLALVRLLEQLGEHLDAEADVALLVARDVVHALGEAGHGAGLGEEVLDVVLARLRHRRLDDQVVERDRLRELRQRAVGAELLAHRLEPAEDALVAPAEMRLGEGEAVGERVAGADHFLEEAVEEDGVAGLVDLLGGEEVLLLLLRGGVDVGGEAVGDRVLAVEEHRVDPERRLALDLGQGLPALLVLAEVDVVGLPVPLLPALVEVLVGDLGAGASRDVVGLGARSVLGGAARRGLGLGGASFGAIIAPSRSLASGAAARKITD